VTFNIWTFLFEVLNFVVLAFILQRLLYRPLRAAIDKRMAENQQARTDAEAARKEAELAREQLATKLAELDRERLEVLRKATEQAVGERVKRLAEADALAKGVREQARHDAEQLRHDTLIGLEGEVGKLAVGLAERLLALACDRSLNEQLARHLADAVRAVSGGEQERVQRDAKTDEVVVESAQSLDGPTSTNLSAAVHELLGRACATKYEVNPSLVGGVLLRIGGHVWDATIAAQLDEAKAAIQGGHDGERS
jgi:F-type H+-transporting ATPase subunit b